MKGVLERWETAPLNEVCSEIVDCINKTAPVVDYETPYKMIRTTNVKGGRVNLSEVRHVDEKTFEKWTRRTKLKHNDVILTREAPLGEVGLLRDADKVFLGQRTMVYRANSKKLNQIFLYYSFLSYNIQSQIKALGSGSTVEHLRVPHAERLKILLPVLPIQRKIAAVLSAYDDLIENNNRRIAILEKMAEELYREWFVRLRFPGHEKVKIVKGVPEGWDVQRINDIVDRKVFGRIYRETELQLEGKVVVIDQSISERLGYYDGEPEHRASKDKPMIIFGDHSCKMQLMVEPFSLAENVIPFIANGKIPTAFLFYLIHNSIETTEYKRHWTELVNKKVFIPVDDLQLKFAEKVTALILQKEHLKTACRHASRSRERLLSRLMSGKIDVEKMDIRFPASMQEGDC